MKPELKEDGVLTPLLPKNPIGQLSSIDVEVCYNMQIGASLFLFQFLVCVVSVRANYDLNCH